MCVYSRHRVNVYVVNFSLYWPNWSTMSG